MLKTNTPTTEELQQLDASHHWHPFSDSGALAREKTRVISGANGVWLYDSEGNEILDGMAGLWCMQVGYGRKEIADAAYEQMLELPFYNTFFKTTHRPAIALAAKLAELSPPHLNRFFFTGSGSEANDTVFRMVRRYWDVMGRPDKQIIIGRRFGYHGSTVAASAMGGMSGMHSQGGMIPGVHHIDPPYWWGEGGDMSPDEFGVHAARKLDEAIDMLGEDKVAAFIAEPIQGAGGVIIPPETYWPEINRILAKRDILFIADEVICGFGRTGNWFGSDTYNLKPDLMPVAKGLSSGYLPIGGVRISDKVAAPLYEKGGEFNHGFTYSAHPAACAAALANLAIIEREKLVERVRDKTGPYMQKKWATLADHPLVGEARMKGLVGALELTKNKKTREFFPNLGTVGTICRDFSFRNGLVMRATRDSMIVSPPLVITESEIDEFIRRAAKTLDDTHARLKQDGWYN